MVKKAKKALGLLVSSMMVLSMAVTPVSAQEVAATGTQKVYVEGDDWGCGVTKTIITLDKQVDPESVAPEDFSVMQALNGGEATARTIEDAYTSDENGNEVTTASNIVTIEMAISPSEGNPIVYTGLNNWADPYELEVTLVDGATLTAGEDVITSLDVESVIDVAGEDKICPQIEDFVQGDFSYNGTPIQYALYSPAADEKTNALVIWNHGGGEYGTDVEIAMLANKVTALGDEEFQSVMDGAYVLVPQRQRGYDNGESAEAIYQLVLKLLAENPDIDPNRVIVGGCSAGGNMTMTMLFAHPDLYAAAYPICPAYRSENATDEMIESIKDIPIWFIHAKNDTTIPMDGYTNQLVERLKEAGAEVHTSIFEDVRDTTGRFFGEDGQPYQYPGHWSWIYFDNNECDENGVNCWQWLSVQTKLDDNVATGSQTAYIIGDDWGPAVSKTIIAFDKLIDADSLNNSDFSVLEEKEMMNWATLQPYVGTASREVVDVYTSDAAGNEVASDSKYVTIEMYVSPNDGSPFIYSPTTGFNSWCDPYGLHITLTGEVTSEGEALTAIDVKADIDVSGDEKIVPQVDGIFDIDMKYTAKDGTVYNYATYSPEKDDKKNALVIWLHGAGEGTNKGENDSYIDLLGNEVTALASDAFQENFDGAYVLVPQAPTMWMDDGTGAYQNGDKGSMYTESLMEMIEAYVSSNPDIDPDKIIIGGCSNGGYMTMEMILTYPDYFAAAFPICEAFQDQYITDEQIEAIKDMPIWFTYAKNDDTVDPKLCTEPTVERLLKAGAKNIHVSAFEDVHDTTGRFFGEDGQPHQYSGHWSWIYFDNGECTDGDLSAWSWLGKQVETVEAGTTVPGGTTTGTTDKPAASVDTGDDMALLGLGILMALSASTYVATRKRFH